MRLLVTRPEADGARTAARLRELGHEALAVPLLEAEWLPPPTDAGPFAAVLFTSANAVRPLARWPSLEGLLDLPVFSVGGRTAEAARALGFRDVRSAEGDVADLSALALSALAPSGGRLLYPTATERAGRLYEDMVAAGFDVRLVEAYRMRPPEVLPEAIAEALAGDALDGVLAYSARSATILKRLSEARGLGAALAALPAFAISDGVAAVLENAVVHVAERPDEAALLALLREGGTSAAGIR